MILTRPYPPLAHAAEAHIDHAPQRPMERRRRNPRGRRAARQDADSAPKGSDT